MRDDDHADRIHPLTALFPSATADKDTLLLPRAEFSPAVFTQGLSFRESPLLGSLNCSAKDLT